MNTPPKRLRLERYSMKFHDPAERPQWLHEVFFAVEDGEEVVWLYYDSVDFDWHERMTDESFRAWIDMNCPTAKEAGLDARFTNASIKALQKKGFKKQ